MSGYLALGYEMSVEYTYPESETLAAGILNIANNVYGIVFVLVLSRLMEAHGDVPVHVGLCLAIFVGLVMTCLTKDEQRRQNARKAAQARTKYESVPQRLENNGKDDGGAAAAAVPA